LNIKKVLISGAFLFASPAKIKAKPAHPMVRQSFSF